MDTPWSVVTAGKGKTGNKKHQQLITFNPTFVQPRASNTDSSQALADQPPPAPVELVVPYIKGAEKGSVFIDITHVKNLHLLREALDAFNKDADTEGRGYNEFLGRCEKNRTYLNHVYMETLWAPSTASYNKIVNEGIMLSDNTFIKGFPSYPADSSIVRITMSGLPFLPLPILKSELKEWLSRFGEVLDYGLSKKDGYYVGGGYATIAIPPGKPCKQYPCLRDHTHFDPLERAVSWQEADGELRKILLTWDAMPDYCRVCGSSEHCRADCPDRYKWLKCYNCHKIGHECRHCPRNNEAPGNEAPSKTRAVPAEPKKQSRKTPLKVNNSVTSPMIVDKPSRSPAGAQDTHQSSATTDEQILDVQTLDVAQPLTAGTPVSHSEELGTPSDSHDTTMGDVIKPPIPHSSNHNHHEHDAQMDEVTTSSNKQHKNRSQSPEPLDSKKVAKTNDFTDVTNSRNKQGQGPLANDATTQNTTLSEKNEGAPHLAESPYIDQKEQNPQKRQLFIRHLRSLGYDVLILQETHAVTSTIIQEFNFQFQTTSSHWTQHCGIVIINNRYSLTVQHEGIDGGRFILAQIRLAAQLEDPSSSSPSLVTILNIYGRSGRHSLRKAFYTELLNIPVITDTLLNTRQSPTLIMGDFNYSYEKHRLPDGSLSSAPAAWISLLEDHYIDCFKDQKLPTWSLNSHSSILDFIFCDSFSYNKIHDVEQAYLSNNWTDHNLLGVTFLYDDPNVRGPGSWKANPFLARSQQFRSALAKHLESRQPAVLEVQTYSSPQQTWDWIKADVKSYIKSYQLADNNWRLKTLKRLQSKRNMMLRQSKNRGLYYQVLETVNVQISSLQESIAEIQALKAGKQWREKGEKHAGYIKRTAMIRETQRSIHALTDPSSNSIYEDQPNKLRIAKDFYTALYQPDIVAPTDIQELLSSIPANLRLTSDDRSFLTSEIDFDDILAVLKDSPRQSSPGSDGLPYEILNLVMRFPPFKDIILTIFNAALDNAIFPDSWNDSIMTLLKKKGDSKDMGNYRPLSLANCDYKCFTTVLNRRLMEVCPKLINSNQIGFIPGKYIAENGLRCQILMEDAELKWTLASQQGTTSNLDRDIGLLLDQEKAYDRVNLSYFRAVLNRFGFPESVVNCLHNLMANNRIQININGYFTDPVAKLRG
ncbi:hypothetical protein, partial, partial [Parasitella parasitica]